MKACPHCAELYADAAEHCPQCGLGPKDRISEVRRSRDLCLDEGFGSTRKRQLIIVIAFVVFLLMVSALSWFVAN